MFNGRYPDGGDPGAEHWQRARDSLAASGFPDSQMQFDTGHKMYVYLHGDGSPDPGFHVQVWHPGSALGSVYGRLGDDPDLVGPLVRRMLGHPGVLGHMRAQMAERGNYDGPAYQVDMTRER